MLESTQKMQQSCRKSMAKKEETGLEDSVDYVNPYQKEMFRYRQDIQRVCQKQAVPFTRFVSKKRCNQTKIVCKLLRYILGSSKLEESIANSDFYSTVYKGFSQMTQINDIRVLLMDERMSWFRNTLKTYILSPDLLLPIISSLSKQSYVKFLLLESLDVLHMMVDDPYRNYSTWMAVRQMAKGDYSVLIAMIKSNDPQVTIEYIKQFVNEVYKLRGMDITMNRKCSDTNNTFYFITSFILRFLKDSHQQLIDTPVKSEHGTHSRTDIMQALQQGIQLLVTRKSHYSLTQIVLNLTLKEFIRREYFQSKIFLLRVLSYEKITSLTVRNIVDKYQEILKMFE